MIKCTECKFKYPEEILNPLITTQGSVAQVCGMCALELSNKVLGAKRTKFQGEMAEHYRQEAINHRKKSK